MDSEVVNKTLESFVNHQDYNKFLDLVKSTIFDNVKLVYGKYLYVFPPIPGEELNDVDHVLNKFSMKYNQMYNLQYNTNPWEDSSESSESD